MCAGALQHVGLSRAVFGCFNNRFGGCGSVIKVHEVSSSKCMNSKKFEEESNTYCSGEFGCRFQGFSVSQMKAYETDAIELLQTFYERGNPSAPDEKRQRPLIVDKS